MKKLRCLVIEDEPLSQEVLARYIAGIPDLELAGICNDALPASGILRNSIVDLIFLDINLPVISGIRFLRSLSHPPMVIFTTAYPEFAVEGFEADAVDYLVKPFSFERFLKAVNKAFERASYLMSVNGLPAGEEKGNQGFIILRADKKVHKVNYSDILFLEATGDYVKVHTAAKTLLVHETFKDIEQQLPSGVFLRVHKSFIVPLGGISFIEGNRLNISGTSIPIGLVYREELMKALKKT
ncbi:MAG: LytTR family DNA-binding domain-containing protein [Bacteroidetes bacterium]|nr:LytTR family DNA-binding domain-containing protein [Bacteroidota bacterium]